MKGFAEMAVSKASRELVPPQPAPTATVPFPEHTISPRLVVAAKHGSQVAPKPLPGTLLVEDKSKAYMPTPIHVRTYLSPAHIPSHVRSYSSPVDTVSSAGSRGDLDEAYYSTASPSYLSVMEAEDFRRRSRPVSGNMTRQDSRDSFLSNDSMLDECHEHSQSFSGAMSDNDAVSVASTSSGTSTVSARGIVHVHVHNHTVR